jgi:DNA-binding HxlR family transcriptional regulator
MQNMSTGYGQYCPLSLASELLCKRWTVLVLSRVMEGCTRFNAIQRGVPRMSPSLLSRRLNELERAGVLHAHRGASAPWREFHLTPAGEELRPLIYGMAVWGQRWAREMRVEDLDPAFLVWSMHTRVDESVMPAGRTVVQFRFSGAPIDARRFWLVSEDGATEMCLKDPGFDVDVLVTANLRVFVETWRGFRDFQTELRAGRIRLSGPRTLCERIPRWLRLHVLAHVPRVRPGREQRLRQS